MASSLSNFVKNISEGIRKIKCKYSLMIKNMKLGELNVNVATVCLNTQTLKTI